MRPDPADRARVRRSALRVGVGVGIASLLVIGGGVALLIWALVAAARPEGHHDGDRLPDGDRVVVDLDQALPYVVVMGVSAALLLAVIAWLAARWAVRPLATALASQRAFVSDASHELRTPLTALTTRVQVLERRADRGEDVRDGLRELHRDAAVLDEVLTDMLMTAESATTPATAIRVGAAIEAAAAAVRPLADDRDVEVVASAPEDATGRIPEITLTRLCVALLDNAVQHAPSGSRVDIAAVAAGRRLEVRVRDRGPGIPPELAGRVFERFARGPEHGRRRGFGLGLSLVASAAARYDGDVRVESTSPDGTTFLLTLPAR